MLKRIFNFFRKKKQSNIEIQELKKRGLILGDNVNIYSECPFDSAWPWLISVGDNSTISTNVKILAHDASTSLLGLGVRVGRVDIGKKVFIGHGVTVLCGVKIGDNSVIGAGSVVTKNVEPNSVYAGVPARFVCTIDEYIEKNSSLKVYDEYGWNEWINAPMEAKNRMRDQLKGNIGLVK